MISHFDWRITRIANLAYFFLYFLAILFNGSNLLWDYMLVRTLPITINEF